MRCPRCGAQARETSPIEEAFTSLAFIPWYVCENRTPPAGLDAYQELLRPCAEYLVTDAERGFVGPDPKRVNKSEPYRFMVVDVSDAQSFQRGIEQRRIMMDERAKMQEKLKKLSAHIRAAYNEEEWRTADPVDFAIGKMR